MEPQGVRILSVTQVRPLHPLPATPPPVRLSFFDCMWIRLQPIKRILLYPHPTAGLADALRSSLAATLHDFLPLAGNLTYVPLTGDVEIDLSDPKVAFVEAESGLDMRGLAGDETHDVGSFSKLVPAVDAVALPFPAFAVQVTRFACGGVAVGYSAHHAVADGTAVWGFVEAWAAACRAELRGEASAAGRRKAVYDRAAVALPDGEDVARELLRNSAPSLPMTGAPSLAIIKERQRHHTRRTFLLDAPSIQALKRRASRAEDDGLAPQTPSTFVALSAHAWISFARAKSFGPDVQTMLLFLMDCRSRVRPPVPDNYFGNFVRPVAVKMPAGELTGGGGLGRACSAIGKSIRERLEDPLGDCRGWFAEAETWEPFGRVCAVAASPRFRVYETDFGWGKPDRVELVSMNHDGEVVLVGGKVEGTVQASVNISSAQMEAFAKSFLGGFRG